MPSKVHAALEELDYGVKKGAIAIPRDICECAEKLRKQLLVFQKEHPTGGKVNQLSVSMVNFCGQIIGATKTNMSINIMIGQINPRVNLLKEEFFKIAKILEYEYKEWGT